jgi:type II secretory ATPase GspE/PulE/Tfp pilus assembly ATPase PilB-like protein
MAREITQIFIISNKSYENIIVKITNIQKFQEIIKENITADITKLLEIIMGGAPLLRASDIHFETEKDNIKLRIRIDGILHNVFNFDNRTYHQILSRIKLLSEIKLNITDKPQDGRFTVNLWEEKNIEIRVSTLPSEYGESIVMRILDPDSLKEIEELGLRRDLLEILNKTIQLPNGMIVVTGPTGSGKTTTLYAILKRINSPEVKIITIEDPIEYHLEGISQTQVNPQKGYDFASGLKAIVRQDPDVILVGEIRDKETATIALQAALTGHLVLTTLHTNDAAGTIARFQALGEKPVNIAPALKLAIAQRLVRKVCPKCTTYRNLTKEEVSFFKKELQNVPQELIGKNINENLQIAVPKGCEYCNFTGYRGRIGIYEFFTVDEEIEEFILTSPSISSLRKKAIEKGMILMKQDGLIKVLQKITTVDEVIQVTGE